MLEVIEFIGLLCTTLFTGAAIYVNLAEHPARMACGTELAATEWAPSYKRAARMQAPLAMIGTLTAFVSWRLTENILWFVGALLIFAVASMLRRVPWTRALLEKWGKLHAVRSILSLLASAVLLIAVLV